VLNLHSFWFLKQMYNMLEMQMKPEARAQRLLNICYIIYIFFLVLLLYFSSYFFVFLSLFVFFFSPMCSEMFDTSLPLTVDALAPARRYTTCPICMWVTFFRGTDGGSFCSLILLDIASDKVWTHLVNLYFFTGCYDLEASGYNWINLQPVQR